MRISKTVIQLKVVPLLASAATAFVAEAPAQFLVNVTNRLRPALRSAKIQLLLNNISTCALAHRSSAEQEFSKGNISAAISLSKFSLQRKILQSELEILKCHDLGLEKVDYTRPEEPRVLYLLTNSTPYTSSGYTQRSDAIMAEVKNQDIFIQAVTRLGYPISVGKLASSTTETNHGVVFHRLLPLTLPFNKLLRLKKTAEQVKQIAIENNISIIHTTTDFKNGLVARSIAKSLGIPWIYELRGEPENTWLSRQLKELHKSDPIRSENYRYRRSQETYFATSADRVVTLSKVSARKFVDRGVDSTKIVVVPNSIASSLASQTFEKSLVRKTLGIPESRIVIGIISSLVDYEGVDDAIRAMAFLPVDHHLYVVGKGTAVPDLEKLVAAQNLGNRVTFVGAVSREDVLDWYAACDVFLVPRKDTEVTRNVTPIKSLQAQALGIPVVASDLPALREVTGGHALYCAPEDPYSLAETIIQANAVDVIAARAFTQTRTWERSITKLIATYNEVLQNV